MNLSISKARLFKACRKAYEFKYIHNLVPVQESEALLIGRGYHSKIEDLCNTGTFDYSDLSKDSAMALAYKKYIYPHFEVVNTEEFVSRPLGKYREHFMFGYVDGISTDGRLVEHKTTSVNLDEYEFDLQYDEQILAYMAMTDMREVYYTICRKPTIRQLSRESNEQFFDRMVEWYDTDTYSKIRVLLISRTDEEINNFINEITLLADDMEHPKSFYRNTSYCRAWGRRCEYSSICMNFDPNQQYIGFIKQEQTR